MKYFWEISVPDDAYDNFINWLDKCENAELTFAFAVIKCYDGHRLLYGFSNFEVLEDVWIRCFDFEFRNDDILCDRFRAWRNESSYFILPFSLLGYFRVMDAVNDNLAEIIALNTDE